MAQIKYDYTAAEVQSDIDNNRDFVLEHDENRIVIEIPKGRLNQVIKSSDGVMMHPDHKKRLGDYIDVIAENEQGNFVLAYLRVKGDMGKTNIIGMPRANISALTGIINSSLRDISDPDIQAEYFPSEVL